MSYPIIAWAMDEGRQRKLPASVRHVLLVLADRANGARFCWPSLPTIAADTGLSARTCHTAVHVLEAEKLVRLERRGRLTYYHILRPTNGLDGDPLQPAVSDPVRSDAYITPRPMQQLQGSEPPEAASLQPLQGLPLQPLQGSEPPEPPTIATIASIDLDPCKSQPSILAAIANKPVKKENQERKEERLSASASSAREFDAFWQSYPRKVGRGHAAKAFAAACRKAPPEVIIAAVQQAVWSPNPRFIPHPTTWLHGERWTDEVEHPDAALLRAVGLSPGGLLQ